LALGSMDVSTNFEFINLVSSKIFNAYFLQEMTIPILDSANSIPKKHLSYSRFWSKSGDKGVGKENIVRIVTPL